MRVRLLRAAKIQHPAGDVVEITDPAVLGFLLNTNTAEPLRAAAEPQEEPKAEPKKPARKKVAK